MKGQTFLTSLLLSSSMLFSNCSGKQEATHQPEHAGHDHGDAETADTKSNAQFEVSTRFQEQLAVLFTNYISLKDAFVASDANRVKEETRKTSEALAKVDMKLLTGAAHNDWMAYLSPMQTSLGEIAASTDIETQRKSFSTVSDNLYKTIKAFGLGGTEAFYDFCPMAFNNEGGYWLSDNDEIKNPYFGDKMLTCGSVKEKLN